jgi:uncharacterized membrane protein
MSRKIKAFSLLGIGGFLVAAGILVEVVHPLKSSMKWTLISVILVGILFALAGIVHLFWWEGWNRWIARIRPTTFPEKLLWIIGGVVGLFFCVMIPYGAGFDETAHLIRVYDVAQFNLMPNSGNDPTLAQFYVYSYQRRDFQSPAFDLFSKQNFFTPPVMDHLSVGDTTSAYLPVNYLLPALVALFFWRVFSFPVLPVIILMRLIGFLFYLAACVWTMRRLPFGKWVFLVLALAPAAVFQAATINVDGITNAVAFMFIGYLLMLLADRETPINGKRAWGLTVLVLLIGCVKPGTFLILICLLLLIGNRFTQKKYAWLIAGSAVLSIVISMGWSYLVVMNIPFWSGGTTTTLTGQAMLVLSNLWDFLGIFFSGLMVSLKTYYTDWVGVYAYWVGKVPVLTYILFPIALLAAFFADLRSKLIKTGTRLLLFGLGFLGLLGISSFQFILHYAPGQAGMGAQGRYFIPFAPILFLAIAGWVEHPQWLRKGGQVVSILALLGSLAAFGVGLYRTYYTNCVFGVSADHPCTVPVYKNVDVVNRYVTAVTAKTPVSQSVLLECRQITSLQVKVENASGSAGDVVTFTARDANQSVLASQEIPLNGLSQGEMLTLPIELKADPGKTQVWLEFSLPPTDSATAELQIFGRKGESLYPDGELLVSGASQDGDLYFQYTCAQE